MAKRQEEVKKGLPAWMGTYGDMVTLLLCFFVLLFSMSSVDVRKFKEAIASFNHQIDIMPGGEALTDGERINNGVSQLANIEIIIDRALDVSKEDEPSTKVDPSIDEAKEKMLEEAKETAEEVKQYIQDQGIEEEIEMKYSLNYVKITLPGETLFDSGIARIRPEALPIIDSIGVVVSEQRFSDYQIQIEGHTDNVPINTIYYPSNWELSAARAIAVGTYLIDSAGFEETKVSCTGYGEFHPILNNDTPENRAINRRVEVKIILQNEEVDVLEFNLDEDPADALQKMEEIEQR